MKYIESIRYMQDLNDESYLNDLAVVKFLKSKKELKFNNNITIIIGENGSGKSTLIEAIAVKFGFNPEGGSRNFNFETMNSHSNLANSITLIKKAYPKTGYFLRSESFYNVVSNIENLDVGAGSFKIIDAYGGRPMHKMSHGESFMALVNNRFYENGLYILDEPESALSPTRLMSLLIKIKELSDNNSQFIIATHSPILMSIPGAEVLEITSEGINAVDYKNTENFIVTKEFLNNPQKMIDYLLKVDE